MPSNKCFYFILHIDNLWFSILSNLNYILTGYHTFTELED
uniref:Uncharacterized protein n=1 Tax=Anguilla anguilla TaxID=7936 RepID=A0A0E9QF03_ANGAN